MLRQGWSGAVMSAVLMLCSAGAAVAQDAASQEEEIRDLKRRLELLEKKDTQAPAGGAIVADPVEEKWYDKVHVGGGIRTEYRSAEQDFGTKTKHTSDFTLDSGRLYTGGKISEVFSATLNAEFTANGASVLDAICQMKVMNEFQIFVGRMLPATDRSNSDGPYYLSTWDFPFLSDGFNAVGKLGDRDDGITFWGDVGAFKYWAGVYEGNDHGGPQANFGDRLLYSARVQYNFMDPEPGYYLQSTYYGDKHILAVGLVANYQGGGTGLGGVPAANVTGFGNVAVDFLWEDKIGDGVATVESAYYYFGRHGFGVPATPAPGDLGGPFDVGAGTGFLFSVAYLIPGKIGWGQFQPHIRYQGFNDSATSANNPTANNIARYDIGVNYVMQGHNARISLVYTHTDITGPKEFGMIVLGTQFQF